MTFGVIVPIALILVINITIFAMIMRKHCVTFNLKQRKLVSTTSKNSNLKRQTVILGTCFINMGLTWTFGFLLVLPLDEYTKTVFSFLFCGFNSLQGFLIFTIYILLSKSRRKYMKFAAMEKFRKIKDTIYTSETKNSRSTKPFNRGETFHTRSTETDTY